MLPCLRCPAGSHALPVSRLPPVWWDLACRWALRVRFMCVCVRDEIQLRTACRRQSGVPNALCGDHTACAPHGDAHQQTQAHVRCRRRGHGMWSIGAAPSSDMLLVCLGSVTRRVMVTFVWFGLVWFGLVWFGLVWFRVGSFAWGARFAVASSQLPDVIRFLLCLCLCLCFSWPIVVHPGLLPVPANPQPRCPRARRLCTTTRRPPALHLTFLLRSTHTHTHTHAHTPCWCTPCICCGGV